MLALFCSDRESIIEITGEFKVLLSPKKEKVTPAKAVTSPNPQKTKKLKEIPVLADDDGEEEDDYELFKGMVRRAARMRLPDDDEE